MKPHFSYFKENSPVLLTVISSCKKSKFSNLTLNLLSNHPAGIGDHSTKDFYENAEEALRMLVDAVDRINMLNELNSNKPLVKG